MATDRHDAGSDTNAYTNPTPRRQLLRTHTDGDRHAHGDAYDYTNTNADTHRFADRDAYR